MSDDESGFSEGEISTVQIENEKLRAENASLRLKTQEMSSEIRILQSKCADSKKDTSEEDDEWKTYYECRIRELTMRLRLADESKKEHLEKCEQAQQIEKEHWVRKIECLQEKLKSSENRVVELSSEIQAKDEDLEKVRNDNAKQVGDMRHDERDALVAAGVYFHSSFPSLKNLTEFLTMRPEVKVQQPQHDEDDEEYQIEKKMNRKLREMEREKSETEVETMKLKAENDILKQENLRMKAKMGQLEEQVSELKELEETFSKTEEESVRMRAVSEEQSEKIAEQQKVIAEMTVDGPAAIQIARLKSENDSLKRRLKTTSKKLKSVKPVMKIEEVNPQIRWDQVEGPEVPQELQETLAKIVENDALQISAKVKLCLKTVCAYYNARQASLTSVAQKAKHRSSTLTKRLTMFFESLSLLLIQRTTTALEVADDENLQGQMVDAVKRLKTELKDSLLENSRLQRSFPSEELVKLRARTKRYKQKVCDLRKEVGDLRRRTTGPADNVEQLKKRLSKYKKQLRERKHEPTVEKVEEDIPSPEARESCEVCGRKFDGEDHEELINELRQRIACLEDEKNKLAKEVEAFKAHFARAKNPLESISEYENLLSQLRRQVDRQKETIETLSKQNP